MTFYKDLEDLVNNIHCKKTEILAREILQCYQLKAYRACLVLLWSITIFDILCKLNELYDFYNNKQAKTLLDKVDAERKKSKKDNFVNSNWEYDIILEVNKKLKTSIVTDTALSQIKVLKEYRNLCAHPSLSENLELFQPNNTLTKGIIISILEELLCKPPLRMDDFINEFVKDLEINKDILVNNAEKLKNFIFNRYFNKADIPSKDKVFKSLWKFIFTEPQLEEDKEIHDANREINYQALLEIINSDQMHYLNLISANHQFYSKIEQKNIIYKYFLQLLNKFENIKDKINSFELDLIRDKVKNNPKLLVLGMSIFDDKDLWTKEVYKYITKFIFEAGLLADAKPNTYLIESLFDQLEPNNENIIKLINDLIEQYKISDSFYKADMFFYFIRLCLPSFNLESLSKLIEVIKTDDSTYYQFGISQINSRKSAFSDYIEFVASLNKNFSDDTLEQINKLLNEFPDIEGIRSYIEENKEMYY